MRARLSEKKLKEAALEILKNYSNIELFSSEEDDDQFALGYSSHIPYEDGRSRELSKDREYTLRSR